MKFLYYNLCENKYWAPLYDILPKRIALPPKFLKKNPHPRNIPVPNYSVPLISGGFLPCYNVNTPFVQCDCSSVKILKTLEKKIIFRSPWIFFKTLNSLYFSLIFFLEFHGKQFGFFYCLHMVHTIFCGILDLFR